MQKTKTRIIVRKTAFVLISILTIFMIQILYHNFQFMNVGPAQNLNQTNEELKGVEKLSENWYKTNEDDAWIEYGNFGKKNHNIKIIVDYNQGGGFLQVFYKSNNQEYTEANSSVFQIKKGLNEFEVDFKKHNITNLRIDYSNQAGVEFKVDKLILNADLKSGLNFNTLISQNFMVIITLLLIYLSIWRIDKLVKYRYIIGLTIFIVFMLLKLNGSSIGMWNQILGEPKSENRIFGVERSIRSDEWLVQTPYFLSQTFSNEPLKYENDLIRSDGQNMVLANAPTMTLETLGKPFYWGFLLFGKDYGLSWFYFSKLIILILLSFEICMILTNRNKQISVLGAFWIGFSAPIQWWFTTGAGVVELIIYSQGIIVSIYYLLKQGKLKYRIMLSLGTLLSTIGFIFTLYPALQVPLGFLVISFVLGIFIQHGFKQVKISKTEWLIYSSYGLFIVFI
uniref:DUF7657 domain-containing protein n=1 Tax=Paenibacillus sp. Marseille-Q4541 TaxID=2831522 RepID=UPI0032D56FC8